MLEIRKTFKKSKDQVQTHKIKIPFLKRIKSIYSDNGKVSYEVDGEDVTIKLEEGSYVDKKVISGEYIPKDSKYVEDQLEKNYSKDGYEGELVRYVKSGEYVKAHSKEIKGYDYKEYNKDGYKGTLEKYLHSGYYFPESTKEIDGYDKLFYQDEEGYRGRLTKYLVSGELYPEKKKRVELENHIIELKVEDVEAYFEKDILEIDLEEISTIMWHMAIIRSGNKELLDYNEDGYKGVFLPKEIKFSSIDDEKITLLADLFCNATKPEEDTRIYKYKGTVTRPETDTRVYKYKGIVTRPPKNTTVVRYKGIVTRPEKDTREFEYYYQYSVKIRYEMKRIPDDQAIKTPMLFEKDSEEYYIETNQIARYDKFPDNPVEGMLIMNTDINKLCAYIDGKWNEILFD